MASLDIANTGYEIKRHSYQAQIPLGIIFMLPTFSVLYLGALVRWVKQLRPHGKLRLEIVGRCDDVKGFEVLPKRWVVERAFGWLVKSQPLRRDYEVRLDHSKAMNHICMIRIMVRRLATI
jgi:hypothetical protein